MTFGVVSNAALQLAANGRINFGQLLQSALSAGATAGIAQLPGVGQHLDGLAGTAAQRLMEYTGRASVQGALQAIMGGNFRDGMANSLLGSLAGEVGQQLNAHINQLQVTHGLNASEASALRLLSRAASSALRVAGSGDAAAGFASDFLGGIMGDALQEHPGTSRTEPQNPLGEFIADNEQAWAERQAAYDQIEEAFSHRPATDRSQDVIVAAGPEYTGLGEDGLGADGVYRVTITGTGASAAAQELERIDQLLQSASGTGVSRAGLYNDLVVDRFRELSAGDQRTILAALDDYANALHDTNALVRSGLAPGSLEARRADLAVRIAADFARQSGAIPANARFLADARVGMETGLAVIMGAATSGDKLPSGSRSHSGSLNHQHPAPANLTSRETFTNLRPNDVAVLQFPARDLYRDVNGRFWLRTSSGELITPSGTYDFVTLPGGRVRVARPNNNPDYSTHLGLSRGQEVSYAGSITFYNSNSGARGNIRNWSNSSGHYKPTADLAGNARLPLNLFRETPK